MRYEMREDEYCHYFYDDEQGVDIKTNEDLLKVMNELAAENELLKIMLRREKAEK
jgi:hypothetical protein